MTNFPLDGEDDRDALSHRLQSAVDARRGRPVPTAALERSLARAVALVDQPDSVGFEPITRPCAQASPTRRQRWSRPLAALAAIVVVAIVSSLWRMSETKMSWAQVVAAVKERPWIHLVQLDKEDSGGDCWIDLARDRTAWRRGKWLYFEDLKSRVHETYDPATETIVRTPLETESLKMEASGANRMLRDLLSDIPEVGSFVYGVDKIVARHDREIVEDGRTLIEFTLELQRGMLVVRVDAATRLPVGISIRDGKEANAPVTRLALEYPVSGPADLYSLGAPRSAKIVDCRPRPEVARIRVALATARDMFGDYVAHVVKSYGQRPTEVIRAWRSGKRFRIEMVRTNRGEEAIPGVDLPAANADEAAWVAEMDRKLAFVPIQLFDGTAMYQRPANTTDPKYGWVPFMHPGAEQDIDRWIFRPFHSGLPHNYLFPEIGYLYEVHPAEVQPKPDDGPAGSVRITARVIETFPSGGPIDEQISKHWFDPDRGFACLKHFRTEGRDENGKVRVECYEMDGFRQNPRGVWYPTIVRLCDEEGKVRTGKRAAELRMHFDFERSIPKDAFDLSSKPMRQ